MIFQLKRELPGGRYMTFCPGDGRLCAVTELNWVDLARICSTANELSSFDGKPVQRRLNKARARKFANYLRDRILAKERFVIPPLVMTVIGPNLSWYTDNGLEWPEEDAKIYPPVFDGIGKQILPAGTTVIVNDGQHRVAGIRMLLEMATATKKRKKKDDPFVGYSARDNRLVAQVQACFYPEEMQQMFTDINGNMSKPSKSLSLFFDKRNSFNAALAELVECHPVLMNRTDVEKNTVGGKSPMVFTMAGLTDAFRQFFYYKGAREGWSEEDSTLASEVLHELGPLWETGKNVDILDPEDLRERSCAPHGVYLKGLLLAVRELIEDHPDDWKTVLHAQGVPHMKNDPALIDRCVTSNGKILAGGHNATLTCSAIKKHLGLELRPSEQVAEMELEAKLRVEREWREYNEGKRK